MISRFFAFFAGDQWLMVDGPEAFGF